MEGIIDGIAWCGRPSESAFLRNCGAKTIFTKTNSKPVSTCHGRQCSGIWTRMVGGSKQRSFYERISRREFVSTAAVTGIISLAGCNGSNKNPNYEPQNGYDALEYGLGLVKEPFAVPGKNAGENLTEDLIAALENLVGKIGKFAIKGNSLTLLKGAFEATRDSFEAAFQAEQTLNIEMMRNGPRQLHADREDQIENLYSRAGTSYSNERPFYVLFGTIQAPLESLANSYSDSTYQKLRTQSEAVGQLLGPQGLIRAAKKRAIGDVTALIDALETLRRTANFFR